MIVLIHTKEGPPQDFVNKISELPGAEDITAVRDGNILVMNQFYSVPATPLSVEGTLKIADEFGGQR